MCGPRTVRARRGTRVAGGAPVCRASRGQCAGEGLAEALGERTGPRHRAARELDPVAAPHSLENARYVHGAESERRLDRAQSVHGRPNAGEVEGGAGRCGHADAVDHDHVDLGQRHPVFDRRHRGLPAAATVDGDVHPIAARSEHRQTQQCGRTVVAGDGLRAAGHRGVDREAAGAPSVSAGGVSGKAGGRSGISGKAGGRSGISGKAGGRSGISGKAGGGQEWPWAGWNWPDCAASSARMTCTTALISARWVKACGKLPRWRPVVVSISSA